MILLSSVPACLFYVQIFRLSWLKCTKLFVQYLWCSVAFNIWKWLQLLIYKICDKVNTGEKHYLKYTYNLEKKIQWYISHNWSLIYQLMSAFVTCHVYLDLFVSGFQKKTTWESVTMLRRPASLSSLAGRMSLPPTTVRSRLSGYQRNEGKNVWKGICICIAVLYLLEWFQPIQPSY